ncbi:hypothetical protein SLA2020_322960 [Shorea laevis]
MHNHGKDEDVEVGKAINDEGFINRVDFEIPIEIGVRVVMGSYEVDFIHDSLKMVKNSFKDLATSMDNCIQNNVDLRPITCSRKNLDLGFKDESFKPKYDSNRPIQNHSMGMDIGNEIENNVVRFHREHLS